MYFKKCIQELILKQAHEAFALDMKPQESLKFSEFDFLNNNEKILLKL